MTAHALERLPIDQLRPWPRNVRTHSRKQVRQIAESIRRFGFTNPVLIDGENRLLAGNLLRVAGNCPLGESQLSSSWMWAWLNSKLQF